MSLNSKLTALADSIRAKSGETGALSLDAMKIAVDSIEAGGGLPNVRKFQITTQSGGSNGQISFPVVTSGRANYLVMNTDPTHLNGTDRYLRALGVAVDWTTATHVKASTLARYDMAAGVEVTAAISDGNVVINGTSIMHFEQPYTLDVYEIIW